MTTARFSFEGDRLAPQFERKTKRDRERVLFSIRAASQDVADEILKKGRADIGSAGNFGPRWQKGLHSEVTEGGGSIRVETSHELSKIGFWVHQKGAVIRGRPLLWIPLSFAKDAQGVRARDFPGRLFRVDRRAGGAPLLFSSADGRPKYSGHAQVTIPKRFHVVEIAKAAARRIGDFYNRRMRSGGK